MDYYTFSVNTQKYVMTVSANGVPLDPDKVNATNCVGQRVTFTLNGLPSEVVNQVGMWKLPTKYVNEGHTPFMIGPPPTIYSINNNLLANTNQTSCWFVNGSGGTVSIGADLLFNNGQHATVAAMGNITIYRPTFSEFHATGHEFSDFPTTFFGVPYLQAHMYWEVMLNSKYDGWFGVTQLLKSDTYPYDTSGYTLLDGNTILYGVTTNGTKQYTAALLTTHFMFLDDSPAAPAIECATMKANFKDYLRFQPNGSDSIYVTIATNGWYMDGAACLIGGITQSNIPPASAPVDNDTFPDWDGYRPGGGN